MKLPLLLLLLPAFALAEHHVLKATPETVVVGYYDATTKPVLRIRSGDTVEIETVGVPGPDHWEQNGLDPSEVQPAVRAIAKAHPGPHPGPHPLTGPIYIEGAQPGDVLQVDIVSIEMDTPYSFNGMYEHGVLADQFPVGTAKIIRLDLERRRAEFAPGVRVPLRPFFGSMGLAPPPPDGRVSSTPPGVFAGNLDNKELVAGTTLYIPVHAPGGLFQAGDGHGAQGDGEVDQTGLEKSLTGVFQFRVRKDMKLDLPRAETPTHWITMGFHTDLDEALKIATDDAVDLLAELGRMSRGDAYMLASVAVDLRVTQVVDVSKGVHAMIPKAIFSGRREE